MDKEILAEHSKGIIVSTGCPSGAIQTRLRLGQWDEAVREAAELQDIFGKESVFLELMDHGISIEKRVRDDLLRLGKELGIPPIATNDSHYNNPEDADAHDALICVASGKRLSDPNRLKFDGGGYYIKSAAEMRELWADRFGMPQACDNTVAIAERCSVEFTESTGGYMARADIPAGETEESWFRKEVWRGIEARYPGDKLTQEVKDRVEMELGVVSQKATAATTSWSPTSSSGPSATASGSAPAVARVRARSRRTRSASPTCARSSTACSSSASSTPSAPRCPTSTSTSTTRAAAR